MIKWLIGFIVLAVAGSCSQNEGNRPMVFWCSNNAGEIAFAKEFTERWQRTRTDKPLRFQPIPEGQSSEEIILASVVGKTTPDIYANMWQGSVEMYAKAHVLIPLDTLKGFMDFIRSRCDSSVIREITSADGHIYQVPWKVNPIMTLSNRHALNSLRGIRPPFSYTSFLEAGRQFKQDNNGDGYTDRWLGYTEVKAIWYQRLFNFYPLYLAASNGAPLIVNNRAAFNNRYAVEVNQSNYKNDYFSRERLSATRDPFIDERIATQFSGPWQVSYLEKFKKPGFEYDFWPMPVPAALASGNNPIYTYGDPKNIVLFNTCRDPQAAWEFVRTLVDNQGDLRLMELTGQFPRRKQLDTDPYFTPYFSRNPRTQPFARQVRYIKGVDNCAVIVEVFDIISQEYEACVIYNRKTPEAAIRDAANAVNVLLENNE